MPVRERPIIFSSPMVRAILDGRKTQTRRVVKVAVPDDADEVFIWPDGMRPMTHHKNPGLWARYNGTDDDATDGWIRFLCPCPFGVVGDLLWVRETWYYDMPPHTLSRTRPDDYDSDALYFRADGECCEQIPECQCAEVGKPKWRTPLHLPRWASRITLEVVSVRVERVQEISGVDILAEGVDHPPTENFRDINSGSKLRRHFEKTWDALNARRGHPWASNPWVWVIVFKRLVAEAELRRVKGEPAKGVE